MLVIVFFLRVFSFKRRNINEVSRYRESGGGGGGCGGGDVLSVMEMDEKLPFSPTFVVTFLTRL